jgi:anthranilate synthase/aminodeoxychorismate synthase-like glutamine amidotransferase
VVLLVDNFDSFTYNLADYLMQLGVELEVLRNTEIDIENLQKKYLGIVLSPGPGEPKDAGQTLTILQKHSKSIPILGVCLGMQAIGIHFGAQLQKASYPMHGKVSEVSFNKEHPLFNKIKAPFNVCRYHSLVLTNLEETNLQSLAETDEGEVMAIAHKIMPVWGVQFHPEAILTTQGMQLLDNWVSSFNLRNNKR